MTGLTYTVLITDYADSAGNLVFAADGAPIPENWTTIPAYASLGNDVTYSFITSQAEISYYNTSDVQLIRDEYSGWQNINNTALQTMISGIFQSTDSYADLFSQVLAVNFTQAAPGQGLIDIGMSTGTVGGSSVTNFGAAYGGLFSYSTMSSGQPNPVYGDIWLPPQFVNGGNPDPTSIDSNDISTPGIVYKAVIHEIGHALGLKHPYDTNDGAYVPTDSPYNSYQYTIMTDRPSQWVHAEPTGLGLLDIQALQSIYGANWTTNSDSTVFGPGKGFQTNVTTPFIYTIWAGGGTNLIDASQYTVSSQIDLREGNFSSIGLSGYGNGNVGVTFATPLTTGTGDNNAGNVSIAFGTVVQNAIGSAVGGNVLIGNAWNNVLDGNGNGNTIYSDGVMFDGNPGIDWVAYAKANGLTQWSNDPNYIAPPSLKDNVLIGHGNGNTFFVGKANDVIDGGYNQTDIDSAASAIVPGWGDFTASNYWDAATQFTGIDNISGQALSDIADSNATNNTVNYSKLNLEDHAVSGTNSGLSFSYEQDSNGNNVLDQSGNPIGVVQKGAGGVDGTDYLIDISHVVGSTGQDVYNLDQLAGLTITDGSNATVIFSSAATYGINVTPIGPGANEFRVDQSQVGATSQSDFLDGVTNIVLPSHANVTLNSYPTLGEAANFTSSDGTATITLNPNEVSLIGMIMDLNTDRLYNYSGTGYYQFTDFQNFNTLDPYQLPNGMSFPDASTIIPNFSVNGSFGNDFSAAPSNVYGMFTINADYSATVALSNGYTDYIAGQSLDFESTSLVGTNNGDTFDITGLLDNFILTPGMGTNTIFLNDTNVVLVYRGGTDTISSTYTAEYGYGVFGDTISIDNALFLGPVSPYNGSTINGVPAFGCDMAAGISMSQVQVSLSNYNLININPLEPDDDVASYNAVVTVAGLGKLTFDNIIQDGSSGFYILFQNGDYIEAYGNQVTYNASGNVLSTLFTYWGGNQTLTAPAPGMTMYATGVGNDTLNGDGNSTLYAGSGNDVLSGGGGTNALYGGFGADTFKITTGTTDQIYSYNFAQGDVIQFSDPGFVLNQLRSFISASGTDLELGTRVGVVDIENFYKSAPLFMPTSGSSAPVYEVGTIVGGSNTILAFDGSGDFLGTINSAGALVPIIQPPGSTYGPGYTQTASPGNENLSDAQPSGVFIADTGNDVFQGVGGDTFKFTNSNGQSVVADTGNNNLITFDSTVTDSSVHFSASGANLVINYGTGTGTVTVDGFFGSSIGAPAQTDSVGFADGTIDSAYYINVLLNGIIGSPGTGTVTGLTGGNDLIWGNTGNHTLVGFGNDTFFFRNGDGLSTIEESGASGTSNAIQFDANVDPSSVVFTHSGNNLEINYGTGDNQVTVDNFYSTSYPLIDQITYAANNTTQDVQFYEGGNGTLQGGSTGDYFVIFSDGFNDVATINGGAGPNTYDFTGTTDFEGWFHINGGSGPAGEILLPTTGIQQEVDIGSFTRGGTAYTDIYADTTGGEIDFTNVQKLVLGNDPTYLSMDTIVTGLTIVGGNVPVALGQVTFDGSGAFGGVHFIGGDAYNIMYGFGKSGDILDGGTGFGIMNSDLYGGGGGGTQFYAATGGNGTYIMNGDGGGDVFNFSPGTSLISLGGDTITEIANDGTETIALHGVASSAVTMWDDNHGNLIIQFSPTDMVTVAGGGFNTTTGFSVGNIDQITFDDGSSISLDGGLTLTASQNNQQIWGTGLGDTLIALGNADVLTEFTGFNTFVAGPNSTLVGGNGTDVFQIAQGLGAVTVSNAGGGTGDQIQFSAGFSEHSLVETVSGANLVLTFTGDAMDSVTLINQASAAHQISSLLFSDGTVAQLAPAGQPQPPIAEFGNFTVNENTVLTGNVITNNGNPDIDLNGLPLSVQPETVTTTGGGSLALNANGSFTYTPATGFTGSDSFSYTLQDTSGASSVGTVAINVNAPNSGSPPVTEPGSFSGNENATITGNVITNNGNPDTDPNGLALSVVAGTITTAHGGTVVQNADGSFTYTPATGFYGTDSYSYTLQDTAGLTAAGNVTLTVAPTPPVAESGNYTVTENSTVSGNVITNNGNPDTDPNGLALSVVPETVTTAHGSVTVASNGNFTYTPNSGYYGSDSFGYTLEDSANAMAVGMVNLAVSVLPPVAQPGNYTVAENAVLTGNVITNNGNPDTDPNGLALSVQSATLTTAHGGTVALHADGSFTYTPAAGYYGADSFQYTLENSAGAMAIGNVAIGVAPTPPVAETGSYSVTENSTVSGNVITNNGNPDTDPNGLALSVAAGTFATAHGSVTISSNGNFTYTPNTGYYGSDSFDYTLQDTAGAQSTGLVNIGVNILPPVAQAGSFSAGNTPTVSGNVITNNGNPDTDPNGLTLSVVPETITTANGGQVSLAADGSFTYTGEHGFIGSDAFTYTLVDTAGATTTGNVSISNVFGDTAPTAENGTFNVSYSTSGETVSGNLMANNGNGAAIDIYGDPLHVVSASATTAEGFAVTWSANGNFSVAVPSWFAGTDTFSYTIADPYGLTSTATETINVAAPTNSIVNATPGASLTATAAGQYLIGTGGGDTFFDLGTAAVTMVGGPGDNTYVMSNAGDTIIQAAGGTSTVLASVNLTMPANVDDLQFLGSSNLTVTCNNDGDTIITNHGVDTIYGGTGGDTIFVNNSGDVIHESAGSSASFNTIFTSVSFALPANVNMMYLDNTAAVTETGNNAADTFTTNTVKATIDAGTGNDIFYINNASDVISAPNSGESDTIYSSVTFTASANVNTLYLTAGGLTATANSGNDTLYASNSGDTLKAGAGTDTLYGGTGNDTLTASSGAATIYGGGGTDTINCGTGADTIIFKDATAFTGIATVKSFTNNSGNVIDISDIMQTIDPTQASIDNFVQLVTSGTNSKLNINVQGSGSNWVEIAQINGVHGETVDQMIAAGQLKVHS